MTHLQIPFTEKLHVFNRDDFSEFSPTALVPCLHDGKVVVWESLAIVEYLADAYPDVWPREKQSRAWARSATAEMHAGFSTLRDSCSMSCGIRVRLREQTEALHKDIDRLQQLWCAGLDKFGGPFLAGKNFTAVDAFYAPMAFRQQTFDFKMNTTAMDYVETLLQLPAMQIWYKEALVEPWRDEPHDKLIQECGKVIEDLRVEAVQ